MNKQTDIITKAILEKYYFDSGGSMPNNDCWFETIITWWLLIFSDTIKSIEGRHDILSPKIGDYKITYHNYESKVYMRLL